MTTHRTAGLTRLGVGLGALAAAAVLAPSPAAAVTVQSDAEVSIGRVEAYLASDGTELDIGTALAFDAGPGVSVSATQTAPGFSRASGLGTALITNLLPDEAVTVLVTDFFWVEVLVSLDQPGEAGRGVSAFTVERGATALDRGFVSVRLASDDAPCDWLPCEDEEVDPGASTFDLDLAPGEAARLRYDAYALAVAPVPLPASAWLSLAGLGGLLLARQGRRGRGTELSR